MYCGAANTLNVVAATDNWPHNKHIRSTTEIAVDIACLCITQTHTFCCPDYVEQHEVTFVEGCMRAKCVYAQCARAYHTQDPSKQKTQLDIIWYSARERERILVVWRGLQICRSSCCCCCAVGTRAKQSNSADRRNTPDSRK